MLVVEVIGNLGADATIKEFKGQKFMAFSVAHTESFTDSQGAKRERTTWVSCLKYGESGVLPYLKKGTRIFVRGELSARTYEANGAAQVGINCKVKELQLLGGGTKIEQAEAPEPGHDSEPENNNPFAGNNQTDDLPF